jgi:hypothetical protein
MDSAIGDGYLQGVLEMRPISALFSLVLLPFDAVKDVLDYSVAIRKEKSDVRWRLEQIEEELGL